MSGVRAGPGARSIHRGEAFHGGETPIRWEPPFYFKSTGVKSRLTGQAEEKWNIFSGSRTGRWKNSNFEPVRLLLGMVDVFNVRCKNKNKIKAHCAFGAFLKAEASRKLVSFQGKRKNESDINLGCNSCNHRAIDELVRSPPCLIRWHRTHKQSCSLDEA